MILQDLQNIQAFLKRVPMTGEEAFGWCQAFVAVQTEIAQLTTPVPPQTSTEKPA